jgi:hypothetical protein
MRRRHGTVLLLAVWAVWGAARIAPARADLLEPPRARQGYYIALGAHNAVSYNREDGDGVGPLNGFGGSFRVGQLLTPQLGLGLAIDLGGAARGDDQAGYGALSLSGQLELARNLALHGAVGLGFVSLSSPADDPDELRGTAGAAYTVSLTYDWFISERRSGGRAVTPSLQLRAIPGNTDGYLALIGVEFSWWTGLPNSQLALSPDEAFR